MTELIAIGYPDPDTARLALSEVERLARDLVIRADHVAAITRDEHGTTTAFTNANISPREPAWAMFWTMLFALLYYAPVLGVPISGNAGEIIAAIERSGIDPEFLRLAREALVPESSALFVIVEHVSTERVVRSLERFDRGTVLRSRLSKRTQDAIQEVLHGPDAIAN